MKPSTAKRFPSTKIFSLSLLICLCWLPAFANTGSVAIRENVSHNKRNELVRRLRTISGWSTLDFDRDGYLKLGPEHVATGSRIARDLLRDAVNGEKLIVIADASSSDDVAFCRVDEFSTNNRLDNGSRVYVVLVDFADFQNVMGDEKAREAFNVGWAVLHEIDHVVEDSNDSLLAEDPGECEARINIMRREIGLPIRMEYAYSSLPINADPHVISRFVRLRFELSEAKRKKRYWVIWDAAIVGGFKESERTVSSRR